MIRRRPGGEWCVAITPPLPTAGELERWGAVAELRALLARVERITTYGTQRRPTHPLDGGLASGLVFPRRTP